MPRVARERSATPARGRKATKSKAASKSPAPKARSKTPTRTPRKQVTAETPKSAKASKSVTRTPKRVEEPTVTAPAAEVHASPAKQTPIKPLLSVPATLPQQTVGDQRADQLLAVLGALSTIAFLANKQMFGASSMLSCSAEIVLKSLPALLLGVQTYRQAVSSNKLFPWNFACFTLLFFVASVFLALLPLASGEHAELEQYAKWALAGLSFLAAFRANTEHAAPVGLVIVTAAVICGLQVSLNVNLEDAYLKKPEVIAVNVVGLLAAAMAAARAASAWSVNAANKWQMAAAAIAFFLLSPQFTQVFGATGAFFNGMKLNFEAVQHSAHLIALYALASSVLFGCDVATTTTSARGK